MVVNCLGCRSLQTYYENGWVKVNYLSVLTREHTFDGALPNQILMFFANLNIAVDGIRCGHGLRMWGVRWRGRNFVKKLKWKVRMVHAWNPRQSIQNHRFSWGRSGWRRVTVNTLDGRGDQTFCMAALAGTWRGTFEFEVQQLRGGYQRVGNGQVTLLNRRVRAWIVKSLGATCPQKTLESEGGAAIREWQHESNQWKDGANGILRVGYLYESMIGISQSLIPM